MPWTRKSPQSGRAQQDEDSCCRWTIAGTAWWRNCGRRMEALWGPAGQYYLGCQKHCGNEVKAGALRQWIEDGIQPENVYTANRPRAVAHKGKPG